MAGDQDQIFSMEFGQMADDEDVIVSLPADTGTVITKAADTVVVKTGGGAPTEDPVEDLKGQFAAMTQRATTAENVARQATQHAAETAQRLERAESTVVSSQLDTVLSGLAAAQAETDAAKKDFVAAAEAGDFQKQADAQERISDARARAQRLQEAKADLEDAAKRRPAAGEQQRPQQRQMPTDPVERLIVEGNISPKSASWLRNHPECVTDKKLNDKMMAAHNLAVLEEVALDSDEYFRRIEEGVKPGAKKVDPKPAGDGRRPSSAAAPAAGGGGALNGGTEVRLTKGEAASATDGTLVWNYDDPSGQKRWTKGDPIGLAEMARRKLEGTKAGLYDKAAGS